ncbi:class III signal peptide-containing protein, partial [Candidatus Micrarchaeota archaeon]|nr:class III signal peptide-containing protein [Candidatus Micrarchaeota archaeon]
MKNAFGKKRLKAQGSLEYMILIGVVLAIASVVVLFISGSFQGQTASGLFANCRSAAGQCQISKLTSPDDPCVQCRQQCAD